MSEKLENTLNNFLGNEKRRIKETNLGNGMTEVCDLETGQCHTIKTKDGLVEKVNKTMITEDGRTLLNG